MNKYLSICFFCCCVLLGGMSTSLPSRADDVPVAATKVVESASEKLRTANSLQDFAAVRKELLQAVAAEPMSAVAQFWLAETTRRAVRYASTLAEPEAGIANIDLSLLDADEAVRRYSLAIGNDTKPTPLAARAYFGRGSFYLERGTSADNAKALSDFEAAIARDPKFATAYLARALAQGRGSTPPLDKVFADYNKAITLGIPAGGEDVTYEKVIAPQLQAAAYAGRGALLVQQKQPDKALADFNQAIKLFPEALEARVQRAGVLVQKNASDKALADLNFVLEKQPNFASALTMRAEIYRQQNQNAKARADMRRALQMDGSTAANLTSPVYAGLLASLEAQKRGDEWLAQGGFDEALAEYSKAIVHDKENVAALAGRAAVKMRRADLEGAQADLDNALQLQAENVKFLTLRGQVLARRGKLDLALADLRKATELAPGDAPAWEQIGIVQQAQGEYAAAEKSYDKAVGFAALSLNVPGQPRTPASASLAAVRRLIVRAAQGLDQGWEADLNGLSPQKIGAGVLLVEIELRKHPDSVALKNLNAALHKAGNIF